MNAVCRDGLAQKQQPAAFGLLAQQLKAKDARDHQPDAGEAERRCRLVEQQDAEHRCADRADARPDRIAGAHGQIAKGNAANMMAQMYFQQLFELRRRSPADDLTTQLVQAEEDGNKLTNEELTANIILSGLSSSS